MPTTSATHPYRFASGLAKAVLLSLCSALLVACGGGGGGSSPSEVPNSNNLAPANVRFLEVSSMALGQITASWLPATDDATPASNLSYELHAGADAAFVPNSATRLFEGRNVFQAVVGSGLTPGTRYAFKLVVIDGQGASTTSDVLSATVSDTNATLNPGARVTNLDDLQGVAVVGNQITIPAGAPGLQTGQFVASAEGAEGKGQLRRVESVATANGATVLQTRIASLNEVVSDVRLSSSFKLASVPQEIAAASHQAGLIRSSSTASTGANTEYVWPQTGYRYSASPSTANAQAGLPGSWGPALQAGLIQGKALDTTGGFGRLYMPGHVIVTEGETADFNIHTYIINRDRHLGVGQRRQICRIGFGAIRGVGEAARPSGISLQAGAGRVNNQDEHRPTHIIYPTTITVGERTASSNPYKVNVTLYVEPLDENCDRQTVWGETLTHELIIYVTNDGTALREREVLAPLFQGTGDFRITNNIVMSFQPTVSFDAVLTQARLQSARIQIDAAPLVEQTLRITSSAQGSVSSTVNILPVRKFFKVYMTPGGVPIVISGRYWVDMTIRGNVTGAIDATQRLTIGFNELSYGIEYVNGQYNLISQLEPVYRLTMGGRGQAEANLEISLKPRFVLSAYESVTGTVELEPYMNARAGIEGHVMLDTEVDFNNQQLNLAADADYRLTKGSLGGGVWARVGAELRVLDHTLVAWPAEGQLRAYSIVDDTDFWRLPTLTAATSIQTRHPTDSRAIAIQGVATTLPNPLRAMFPFMPETFVNWANWTNARIVPTLAIDSSSYSVLPADAGGGVAWVVLTRPGTYTIRQGGHSSLGTWARQYVETSIEVTDTNNNGIPDFWEQRFGLQGAGQAIAAGDPDGDGLTNLQEWLAGADPLVSISQASIQASATSVSIGQTIVLWVTGAWEAVTSVVWSFGDMIADAVRAVTGGSSVSDTAEVVYNTAGPKTITATYRDVNNNIVGVSTATLVVTAGPPAPTINQAVRQADGTIVVSGTAMPGVGVRITWPNGATDVVLAAIATGTWSFTSSSSSFHVGESVSVITYSNAGFSSPSLVEITGGATALARLPHSGITAEQCYAAGGSALLACSQPAALALNAQQDGHRANINAMSYSQVGSHPVTSCVKDNVTGLIWEGKEASGTRAGSNTYTNYHGTHPQVDAAWNTHGYVAAVNAMALCGFTDWRLPTVDELQSIVDYGVTGPAINRTWFPNSLSSLYWYWSSSPVVGEIHPIAWGVNFGNGLVSTDFRNNPHAVRLVRASQ